MDLDRWRRIDALFHEAVELPPQEREPFLRTHSADDAMRREVLSLLAQDAQDPSFMSWPALGAGFDLGADEIIADGHKSSREGTQIDRYRIERQLGMGGMGAVYLASRADHEYQSKVALKILRPGLDPAQFLERFLTERQTLANLNHPNIARLLDGGRTNEGLPYLVLEYIDGVPIDEYCDRQRLTVRQRLELFCVVCSAVHFAHQNLVIHRDIKPSNILVTSDGVPKLLDFGIAKVLDQADRVETQAYVTSAHLLTPEYASPEQLRREAVTTATDIYSLGVVLYGLLTSRLPYRLTGKRISEIERAICDIPPEKPSTAMRRTAAQNDLPPNALDVATVAEVRRTSPERLRRHLRGDIDNILLMALRKEPHRRYQSAQQFSEDVQRYLAGMPVVAHRDTMLYRVSKFVRRNRIGVAAAAAVILALAGGVLATSWQAHRADVLRAAADQAKMVAVAQADHARIEAESAHRTAEFLMDVFRQSDPNLREIKGQTAQDVLDHAAERLQYELAGQPHLRANLLDALGRVYLSVNLFDRAQELITQAATIRRERFTANSHEYALSLRSLGQLALAQGNSLEAERQFQHVLELYRALPVDVHTDVPAALEALAGSVLAQNRREEARLLLEEALKLRRESQNDHAIEIAITLSRLAEIHMLNGQYVEAEVLLREALMIRSNTLGQTHPATAHSMKDLATSLHHQEKFDESSKLLIQAIDHLRQVYTRHPDLARAMNAYGKLLSDQGKVDEAERMHIEALQMQRNMLRPDHPDIAETLTLLQRVQRAQHK